MEPSQAVGGTGSTRSSWAPAAQVPMAMTVVPSMPGRVETGHPMGATDKRGVVGPPRADTAIVAGERVGVAPAAVLAWSVPE